MPRVVSIYSDQAGTGKSTAAAYLCDWYGFHHVSFAAPVKQAAIAIASPIIGVSTATDWMVERKEAPIHELGGASLVDLCCTIGFAIREKHPGLLASIGKASAQEIVERGGDVVIDDMRHVDEWHAIAKLGGEFVKLTRTTNTNTRSDMEGLLADLEFDVGFVIDAPQGDHSQLYGFLDTLAEGQI